MSVLEQQLQLKLVVIAGDESQLPPTVNSLQGKRNPLGDILSIYFSTWLLEGYPNITRFALTVNFRAHPSLIPMPSQTSYGGDMAASPSLYLDTLVAQKNAQLLVGRLRWRNRQTSRT